MLRFTEAYKVYTEAYNNANEQISQAKGHSCKEDIVISLFSSLFGPHPPLAKRTTGYQRTASSQLNILGQTPTAIKYLTSKVYSPHGI